MDARTTAWMRNTARSRTAPATRVAGCRKDGATRTSIRTTAATRAARSARAPARPAHPIDSRDAKRCVLVLERGPDLIQAGAREVSLGRLERVTTEPRELEQPRQPIHRAARKDQAPERLTHELLGRLPGRARHPRARRDSFESAVALDDRRARVGLAGEVIEALVDRFGELPG